ncbi:MAG TPA: TonB-dependent receptor [Chryseosolibacter sp.]
MLLKPKWIVIALLAWSSSLIAYSQKITINGTVRDRASKESLIGATIFCPQLKVGTTSNAYGFYSITVPASDSVILVVSYVGYQSQVLSIMGAVNHTADIALEAGEQLKEVEIVESRIEHATESSRMATIDVPIAQIKGTPALLGEVDVLKVLQLMPGVQSGTEGSSGLYVRGGGADQNLILLDGVPVYNASHLFGFFSVFNADAINHVELVKGGFPARFGGRLSSVVNMTMKEGNTEKVKAEGSIGLIASKLTVDGPVGNKQSSFLISARRTYLDAVVRPVQKLILDKDEVAGYYFYDLNAKINHRINAANRLFLSLYTGHDKGVSNNTNHSSAEFESSTETQKYRLRWGNITAAARWNAIISPQMFSNVSATYSRYQFSIRAQSERTHTTQDTTMRQFYSSDYSSGISDVGLKAEFEYFPSLSHTLRFGAHATHHAFTPGAVALTSNVSIDTVAGATRKPARELAAYIEDDFFVSRAIRFNLGIHAAGFAVDNSFYSSLQPRLATRVLLNSKVACKLSYVWMTQFIHLLTNSGIGLPTDLWVPATGRVQPQHSTQASAGLAWDKDDDYELTIEGYYKEMRGLIEYQDGSNYLDVQSDWQDKIVSGRGESYGIELFAHRKTGKISGWLGYTLSWANRKFPDINQGAWFPYRYDRRHDIEIVSAYKPKPSKDISVSWLFGTGNAVTLPKASYLQLQDFARQWTIYEPIEYYGGRNNFRMRPYHRLDVSYAVRKKKKWGERSWTFSIYNVYNRKNPFFLQVNRGLTPRVYQYSLFPIIPSAAYGFKF